MRQASRSTKATAAAEPIREGFCTTVRSGVQAHRVPFDSFGGFFEGRDGQRVSPLQLIVDAASSTNDYSVFASKPLVILLQARQRTPQRTRARSHERARARSRDRAHARTHAHTRTNARMRARTRRSTCKRTCACAITRAAARVRSQFHRARDVPTL
eukprot:6113612-Pleurochrysis_carterae.AAC.1